MAGVGDGLHPVPKMSPLFDVDTWEVLVGSIDHVVHLLLVESLIQEAVVAARVRRGVVRPVCSKGHAVRGDLGRPQVCCDKRYQ